MFPYLHTIKEFLDDCDTSENNRVVDLLTKRVGESNYGMKLKEGEILSWKDAFSNGGYFQDEFCRADGTVAISNLVIGLEYFMERDAGRVDIMIMGKGKDKNEVILVIEIKRWSGMRAPSINEYKDHIDEPKKNINDYCVMQKMNQAGQLEDFSYSQKKLVESPVTQAIGYCNSLRNRNNYIFDIQIVPVVCLINMLKENDNLIINDEYDVIYKDENSLHDVLKKYFAKSQDADENRRIAARLRTGYQTLSVREMAAFLDEKDCSEKDYLRPDQVSLLEELKEHSESDRKFDVVYGAPGSGKTLLAVLLLKHLCKYHKDDVAFVYQGAASANALIDALGDNSEYKNRFVAYDHLRERKENYIIIDEASTFFIDKEQYDELVERRKHIYIFGDPLQKTKNEEGKKHIMSIAPAPDSEIRLWTQFRCNGDDGYIAWLDQFLCIDNAGINKSKKQDIIYLSDLDFQPKLLEKTSDVVEWIKQHNYENRSVILNEGFVNTNRYDDIKRVLGLGENSNYTFHCYKHGDKEAVLNEKVGLLKSSVNDGFITVASTAAVQGVEYNEILVIIGKEEMTADNTVVRPGVLDSLIWFKHKYRILLTRATKELSIYIEDKGLRQRFKSMQVRPL